MGKIGYRHIFLVFIVLIFCGWQGQDGCKPPTPPGLPELLRAINDLSSNDYVKVRQAILVIEKNNNNPLTKNAINPLIEIANN